MKLPKDFSTEAETIDHAFGAKRTYSLRGVCFNCGWKGMVKIAKGHSKPHFVDCPNCEVSDVRLI